MLTSNIKLCTVNASKSAPPWMDLFLLRSNDPHKSVPLENSIPNCTSLIVLEKSFLLVFYIVFLTCMFYAFVAQHSFFVVG